MKKGFTLIELLIVMSVVAILVSIVIPSFRSMQQEGWLTKAEQEVQTVQIAVESYFRHTSTLPPNITSALTNAVPRIITQTLRDPWSTNSAENTYGYVTKNINNNPYYVIYSQGINGKTDWSWAPKNQPLIEIAASCDDLIQTNAAKSIK